MKEINIMIEKEYVEVELDDLMTLKETQRVLECFVDSAAGMLALKTGDDPDFIKDLLISSLK